MTLSQDQRATLLNKLKVKRTMTLDKTKEVMEEIAGEWNGEDSGILEERADIALEVIKNIEDIQESLDYLGV